MAETIEFDWRNQVPSLIEPALRLAVRLCGDNQLAEDAVQEALMKLARYGTSFNGQSQLSTYFTRIVINVCNDLVGRKRKRNEAQLPSDSIIGSKTNQPEFATQQNERLELIRLAIEKLPERQRNVLVLTVWEQLSPDEIGELLEMKVQNVYATLSLARQHLRQMLNTEFAD